MIALCKYCNEPISDHDMAMTDKEKELYGGGAKYVGHLGNALFAHQECYDGSEDKGK